eukprot:scaffold27167_cov112-Isochrysis_galbana.AAC.3
MGVGRQRWRPRGRTAPGNAGRYRPGVTGTATSGSEHGRVNGLLHTWPLCRCWCRPGRPWRWETAILVRRPRGPRPNIK